MILFSGSYFVNQRSYEVVCSKRADSHSFKSREGIQGELEGGLLKILDFSFLFAVLQLADAVRLSTTS